MRMFIDDVKNMQRQNYGYAIISEKIECCNAAPFVYLPPAATSLIMDDRGKNSVKDKT